MELELAPEQASVLKAGDRAQGLWLQVEDQALWHKTRDEILGVPVGEFQESWLPPANLSDFIPTPPHR